MTRYTNAMYKRSLKFAMEAHCEHPIRVSENITLSTKEKIIAALHDTIEDTSVTAKDIEREFGKEIRDAVVALTHKSGSDYAYLQRVKGNKSAYRVKLVDLHDNMHRLKVKLSEKKKKHLDDKYKDT